MRPKTPFIQRFLRKIQTGATPHACWRWLGCKNNVGYGLVRGDDGHMTTAHRAMARFILGWRLKPKQEVQHICMNYECTNPDHLVIGDRDRRNQVRLFRLASLRDS
jgi:hypothetical protein